MEFSLDKTMVDRVDVDRILTLYRNDQIIVAGDELWKTLAGKNPALRKVFGDISKRDSTIIQQSSTAQQGTTNSEQFSAVSQKNSADSQGDSNATEHAEINSGSSHRHSGNSLASRISGCFTLRDQNCIDKYEHFLKELAKIHERFPHLWKRYHHIKQIRALLAELDEAGGTDSWRVLRDFNGIRTSIRVTSDYAETFEKNPFVGLPGTGPLHTYDENLRSHRLYSIILEGTVQLEFFPLLSLLNEADWFTAWVPSVLGLGLSEAEIFHRVNRCDFDYRGLIYLPKPFAPRRVCFNILGHDCMTDQDEQKQVVITLNSISESEEDRKAEAYYTERRRKLLEISTDEKDLREGLRKIEETRAVFKSAERAELGNSAIVIRPVFDTTTEGLGTTTDNGGEKAETPEDDDEFKDTVEDDDDSEKSEKDAKKDQPKTPKSAGCHVQIYLNVLPRIKAVPEFLIDLAFANLAFLIVEQVRRAGAITQKAGYLDRQRNPRGDFYHMLRRRIGESLPWESTGPPVPIEDYGLHRSPTESTQSVSVGVLNGFAVAGSDWTLATSDRFAEDVSTSAVPFLDRRITVVNCKVGMKVRRGLDWIYGDEDMRLGIIGGFGTVVSIIDSDGTVISEEGSSISVRDVKARNGGNGRQVWAEVEWNYMNCPGSDTFTGSVSMLFSSNKNKKVTKKHYRLGPQSFDLALYIPEEDNVTYYS